MAKGKLSAEVAAPDRPEIPPGKAIRQKFAFQKIYKEKFCDQVIEFGQLGASLTEMAIGLGVTIETFNLWRKKYPEFGEAVKLAQMHSQVWWEQRGRIGAFSDDPFNATAYIFTMKNMFRHDWSDVKETRVSGVDGGAIKVEHKVIDGNSLDAEEREAVRQALLSALEKDPDTESMDEN